MDDNITDIWIDFAILQQNMKRNNFKQHRFAI